MQGQETKLVQSHYLLFVVDKYFFPVQCTENGLAGEGGSPAISREKLHDRGCAITLLPFMEELPALVPARIQMAVLVIGIIKCKQMLVSSKLSV